MVVLVMAIRLRYCSALPVSEPAADSQLTRPEPGVSELRKKLFNAVRNLLVPYPPQRSMAFSVQMISLTKRSDAQAPAWGVPSK